MLLLHMIEHPHVLKILSSYFDVEKCLREKKTLSATVYEYELKNLIRGIFCFRSVSSPRFKSQGLSRSTLWRSEIKFTDEFKIKCFAVTQGFGGRC